MSSLLKQISKNANRTTTTNGDKAFLSTKSHLLDFFSEAGAMRVNSEQVIASLFMKAYAENPNYALKALFFMRDIRGGNGERKVFRAGLKALAYQKPKEIKHLVKHIAEFGRYDDLLVLLGTPLENKALKVLHAQFEQDLEDMKAKKPISLLGKWLPSINASSPITVKNGRTVAKHFGLSERNYRKQLSDLRKYINILERNMSLKTWEKVDYSKLPSQALLRHKTAFFKNDEEKYLKFINKLQEGEVKVNAGSLYPYQLVQKVFESGYQEDTRIYDGLWKALPELEDSSNSLAVVDTSGSMYGNPINVAVSLGLYLAENNTGLFKDHFITFSSRPKLQKITGDTFTQRVLNIRQADWGFNTNLLKTFEVILEAAVEKKLPQSELPSKLFIISDMQFDSACGHNNKSVFKTAKNLFEQAGYDLPHVVFWNVGDYSTHPVTKKEKNVTLVSGFSQNLFASMMNIEGYNPYDSMLEMLNNERYEVIKLKK